MNLISLQVTATLLTICNLSKALMSMNMSARESAIARALKQIPFDVHLRDFFMNIARIKRLPVKPNPIINHGM